MNASSSAAHLPCATELYRRHQRRALAVARSILGDDDEAEDVVQEVFSRLCLRPGRFDGRCSLKTWIHRLLVNSSINRLRARRRSRQLRSPLGVALTPEEEAIGHELGRLFEESLHAISARQSQILWLREVRGLSYPQIARLVGVPEGTVKSTLNRARAQVLARFVEAGHGT
jgi:RNA polymerase sigma-70 factor (ECF subfamily)